MPRVKDGVERMTPEEIEAIAKEAKVEIVAERKIGRPKTLKTEGITSMEATAKPITEVGLSIDKKATPDKAIDSKFKFTPAPRKGWIPMSEEEAAQYTKLGILAGYDPSSKIGLLSKD